MNLKKINLKTFLLILTLFYCLGDGVATQIALNWILLFMANYPQMQRRMRKKVEQIGQRILVENDNHYYVNTFISETLRHTIGSRQSFYFFTYNMLLIIHVNY